MEDFLIELRYFLIKKINEAPIPHGGFPHWTQVLAGKMTRGQEVLNEDGVYSDLIRKQGIEIPAHNQIFDKQHEINTYNYDN